MKPSITVQSQLKAHVKFASTITVTDNDYLTRAYLPSIRGLTDSLYWASSWSFFQCQFLTASQLGPLLQHLFSWFPRFSEVLLWESKNQKENFFTKELYSKSKRIFILVFDCYYKTTENLANHVNKSWRRGPNWLAAKNLCSENDQVAQ